jgi:hypothetical protein
MMYELCIRPEWQPILRDEVMEHGALGDFTKLNQLPLLDGFLRETARLNSVDKSKRGVNSFFPDCSQY